MAKRNPESTKVPLQRGTSSPHELRAALLSWYSLHSRELPWRQNRDAYRVWISEIMLQQTRVAAVLEHYRLFLEAFPTVEALARAQEEQVLALWSGLGYYRRARMLHRAARVVVAELGGMVPREVENLRKLPGVGRYTAAAIASIAYGEPAAVVDGNVQRVLSRLDGQSRTDAELWHRAQQLLDLRHPGDWNQAMMELGATVCTPQSPQCLLCPVRPWCRTQGAVASKPKAARKRVRMVRALILRGERVYLVQRPPDATRMAGMWELPEVAGQSPELLANPLCVVRHSITDTDYDVHVITLKLSVLDAATRKAGRWLSPEEWTSHPLTGLTRKILRRQGMR